PGRVGCTEGDGVGDKRVSPGVDGGRVRRSRAWYRGVRPIVVFTTGGLLIGLSAAPAFALGAPDAPTITGVTAGDAPVVVAFTAGNNNGSAITSFSASCTSSNGGVSSTNTSAASPITVSSLTNGKLYTCTVTATNAIGTSPPSIASL